MRDAPERSFHTVHGARIETLTWGRIGDPGLLLLHGNGAHADWWSFIAPMLADGHRVTAMSWSGMGGSDWRSSYSMDLHVDEAFTVARESGLFESRRRPVFVGHSFGGFPTMACAARQGERLHAAIAVDSPLFTREQRAARHAKRGPPRDPHPSRIYPSLAAALARFRFMPPQDCENLFLVDHIARGSIKEVRGEDGTPGWTWRFDPFLWRDYDRGDSAADLARVRCPFGLIRGQRSALVRSSVFAYARSVAPPGSPAVEVPDADHHVMADQPLAFVAALRGLLAAWP
jgi:pimeloyl-ACP methyl ester carboxylesterase